jgi:hypothetical protein
MDDKERIKELEKRNNELSEEIIKLREIIKNGGLSPDCELGYSEIKFCSFRNGEGDHCLRCFN